MSDELGNKNSSDDLKQKILSSMNTTFTGDATNRWITAMKDEAFDQVEESVVPVSESSKLNHSMAAVIDRLFDNFKRYSFEYNRTQDDREFEINCERPASMRTSAEYLDMGKPIKFCLGHLASRHWAMVIQGEENRILVFITPVEYLVGFKPSPPDFPPHMEMRLSRDTSSKTSREFVWGIGGQMLSQDSLPILARRLFTQLVKVCKSEANYGELFSLSPQEEKMALAQSANASIDRTFENDNSMFLGQKKPDLSDRTFVVAAEQVEQLTAAMAGTASPSSASSLTSSAGGGERPPLNAMITPSPLPASISASSSYPQVAAAIANGEPKALSSQPDGEPSFPRTQSYIEQAQTFPRLPAPDIAPAPVTMARTFGTEPATEEAIAAIVFPAPPSEEPAPSEEAATDQGVETAPAAPAAAAVQTEPAAPLVAAPAPAASTPAPLPTSLSPAAPNRAVAAAIAFAAESAMASAPASAASPWIGPNGEPARTATPSQTSMEIPSQVEAQAKAEILKALGNNGQSGLDKQAQEAKANIAQSLKGLFETVDKAISGFTTVGMEAMHGDDLNTVSAVMKQTKSLKTLRDSVVALSKDWQQANQD